MKAYLEITNVCNRACVFCPGTTRKKEFVPPDVFARRLGKLHDVQELYLHLMGEPLLHPQFEEIVLICQKKGIPVTLTTNGTLLDDAKEKILLENPIFHQVNFSLQALSPDESGILDRILLFCRNAAKIRPQLYVNLRMWDLNEKFEPGKSMQSFSSRIFRQLGLPEPEKLKFHEQWHAFPLTGRIYLHANRKFEWPVDSKKDNGGILHCLGLISQFGVHVDGNVVPCCLDSDGAIILGNLDRQPLEEILSSARAKAIRTGFQRGIAVEPFCRKCTFRQKR